MVIYCTSDELAGSQLAHNNVLHKLVYNFLMLPTCISMPYVDTHTNQIAHLHKCDI